MDKFHKNCNCKDWKDNCEILDSAIVMGLTHGMKGLKKSFDYCPWCGKTLVQEKSS